MPAGYSRPVLMINAGVKAFDDLTIPTPVVIKGCRHLSGISGDVLWATGVTTGRVVVDIIPTEDYPDDQDGEIVFDSDIALLIADTPSQPPPRSQHFTYFGMVPYIRHRIMTDIAGGADPSVTTYHDGITR